MSSSKIPPHMVSWLSAEGWTAEELSFVDKYSIVYKIDMDNLDSHEREKVQSLMRAQARLEAQKGERAREYDSKNNYQGKDSPQWFRASIDRDLFK